MINTKHRTNQIELMDDFTMKGELLANTLDQLATQIKTGHSAFIPKIFCLLCTFDLDTENFSGSIPL